MLLTSYVLWELTDQDGNKSEAASKIFSLHDDFAFSQEFGNLVAKAYTDLFELHGDNAWGLNTDALITFFRSSDETTAIVGKLQASTFQILAAFSGYGEIPELKASSSKPSSGGAKKTPARPKKVEAAKTTSAESKPSKTESTSLSVDSRKKDFGLTVRIEINLPSDGDQETYDRIFKSIRENLLDG